MSASAEAEAKTEAKTEAAADELRRLVELCSALADESRWEILRLLGREDRSASELARELPISRQAIAKHLGQLEEAGLVDRIRDGRSVRYRALGSRLARFAADLETIGRGWERRLDRLGALAEAVGHAEGSAALTDSGDAP